MVTLDLGFDLGLVNLDLRLVSFNLGIDFRLVCLG